MSFKLAWIYIENGFLGNFPMVFIHVEYLSTISGSNATIYNSKTAKGGIVQKKANQGLFFGIAGYLPPLGVPQFMSTSLIYPCTAQKVAAVGSRCQPNFG